MNTQAPDLQKRISKWMENWLLSQHRTPQFSLKPLAGDGSTRVFFRVQTELGVHVLLSDPEWILSKDYASHQAYLSQHGIPTPRFITVDEKEGFCLMEDLGDELLQFRLLKDEKQKLSWMEKAITLLADLHGKTYPVPDNLPVASRAFDAKKYGDELAFTEEHLTVKYLGLPSADAKRQKALKAFAISLESIRPWVFSHRDYHSRNLLLHGEKLYMIDFQDARMGPVEYDLASFVFDPYVPTTEAERKRLCEIYHSALMKYPLGKEIDWKGFERRLGRVGLQRVIKAAGSFTSFYTRYGKRTHLAYLVPALETAQRLQTQFGDSTTKTAFPLELWLEKANNQFLSGNEKVRPQGGP